MPKPFEIEAHGHVRVLWLSHPERKNAMGPEFWAELPDVIHTLDQDPEVRAVVVAARGSAFSSGLDLMRMAAEIGPAFMTGGLAADRYAFRKKIIEMRRGFDAIVASNKPFIAAVHGYCIGGGLDLVAACDVRLAASDALFSLRETRIAIVADMGSLQRLSGIVSRGVLRELALTGKDIDAQRALRVGLINELYDSATELHAAALEMAQQIAANAPLVVQGTKEVLRVSETYGEAAGLDFVATFNAAYLASEDLQEAMSAFVEKRNPTFKGR